MEKAKIMIVEDEAITAMNIKAELSKTKVIVTYCGVGLRASHAHRILKNAGFENTKFMEGSMSAWPYNVEK